MTNFTYIHGWRRKLGCVTLVMALVFVAGWIRSLVVMDVLLVPSGTHSMEHCVSVDHVFVWGRVRKAAANSVIPYPVFATDAPRSLDSFLDLANLKCNWRSLGFAVGELNVTSVDRFITRFGSFHTGLSSVRSRFSRATCFSRGREHRRDPIPMEASASQFELATVRMDRWGLQLFA